MTALLSAPHAKPSYDRSSSGGEGTGRPVAERFGDTRDQIQEPLLIYPLAHEREGGNPYGSDALGVPKWWFRLGVSWD